MRSALLVGLLAGLLIPMSVGPAGLSSPDASAKKPPLSVNAPETVQRYYVVHLRLQEGKLSITRVVPRRAPKGKRILRLAGPFKIVLFGRSVGPSGPSSSGSVGPSGPSSSGSVGPSGPSSSGSVGPSGPSSSGSVGPSGPSSSGKELDTYDFSFPLIGPGDYDEELIPGLNAETEVLVPHRPGLDRFDVSGPKQLRASAPLRRGRR